MFTAVFAIIFLTVQALAEIPSYIHICGSKDPNLDQCILDNILNLQDKICVGIPELDIPSQDPMRIDYLPFLDSGNNKIYLTNVQVYGFCKYKINFFHLDLEKNHFDVDVIFDRLEINGTYNVDIRILIPIIAKGHMFVITNNTAAKVGIDMKTTKKDGKTYVYMSKMTIKLDIKGYDYNITLLSNTDSESGLYKAIGDLIGNNQQEVIRTIRPPIEKTVSKQILDVANKIVTHFTYEELFPDRE